MLKDLHWKIQARMLRRPITSWSPVVPLRNKNTCQKLISAKMIKTSYKEHAGVRVAMRSSGGGIVGISKPNHQGAFVCKSAKSRDKPGFTSSIGHSRPSTTSKLPKKSYLEPMRLSSSKKRGLRHQHNSFSSSLKNSDNSVFALSSSSQVKSETETNAASSNEPINLFCGHISGAVSIQGFKPSKPDWLNQDNVLEMKNFNGSGLLSLHCVFDGHGRHGREVSEYCVKHLASCLNEADVNVPFTPLVGQRITQAFLKMDNDLRLSVDTTNSGSTAVVAVLSLDSILLAHVGDSRAMVGRFASNYSGKKLSKAKVLALTSDHKPDRPDENERVCNSGGRVCASPHHVVNMENATQRVWSKNKNLCGPGLAVSRSFGDAMAHSCGVTSIPEVRLYKFQPEDRWICIATDGVWDVMSLNDVAGVVNAILSRNPTKWNPQQAARMIVATARKRWRASPQANGRVDDITALIIRLHIR